MNRFLIVISVIFFLSTGIFCEAYSADKPQTAEISKIENDIYGFDYENDILSQRVERLEKTIYGKPSSGDLNKRIQKLAKDIFSEQIGLEITPSEDTFSEENQVADNSVDYPVLNEIEMKLFNQTYKNRDFHTRIVTIERKLFNKIYDVDDYQTRMDRIKTEIMPEALAADSDRFNYNSNDTGTLRSYDLSGLNNDLYSHKMPYGQRNYTRPYSNYGNEIPPDSNLEEELAELEYDAFGTEFSNESPKSRIKRLKSVNKAKKSSRKYDSQKFQQRLSTAMEIGAMILMILAMVL